jgi:hypothetical protein
MPESESSRFRTSVELPEDKRCPVCLGELEVPRAQLACTPIPDAPNWSHMTVCVADGVGFAHLGKGWTPECTFHARRGWCVPCSLTISSAGPPCSVISPPRSSSPWPGPCAPGSCPPGAWSAAPVDRHCGLRSSGHGRSPSHELSCSCGPYHQFRCSNNARGRRTADEDSLALTSKCNDTNAWFRTPGRRLKALSRESFNSLRHRSSHRCSISQAQGVWADPL